MLKYLYYAKSKYGRMKTMKCPHLFKWLTYACKAKKQLYVPSSFQLEEYCKCRSHSKCPFFASVISHEEVYNKVLYTHTNI
jgi:hypothetical protein